MVKMPKSSLYALSLAGFEMASDAISEARAGLYSDPAVVLRLTTLPCRCMYVCIQTHDFSHLCVYAYIIFAFLYIYIQYA